jgi:hypothetical protein
VALCAPLPKNCRQCGQRAEKESSHNGDGVVVEHGGDIFRGELVGGVADEQTCLADSTVTDDDASARRGC